MIFKDKYFVLLNEDGDEIDQAISGLARKLIQEHGGTLVGENQLPFQDAFPINFGDCTNNVMEVLWQRQDVYHPSLIFDSVEKQIFDDPGLHYYCQWKQNQENEENRKRVPLHKSQNFPEKCNVQTALDPNLIFLQQKATQSTMEFATQAGDGIVLDLEAEKAKLEAIISDETEKTKVLKMRIENWSAELSELKSTQIDLLDKCSAIKPWGHSLVNILMKESAALLMYTDAEKMYLEMKSRNAVNVDKMLDEIMQTENVKTYRAVSKGHTRKGFKTAFFTTWTSLTTLHCHFDNEFQNWMMQKGDLLETSM